MASASKCKSYRGDRLVFHGGGWPGWGTLMTLVPDFGIGVAVLTNRSPSEVPSTLTWYIIDRLRGREPVDWRERFRKRREQIIAQMQVDKDAREKARHKNTRAGARPRGLCRRLRAPAYGVMSIKEQDGALHWRGAACSRHGAPALRDVECPRCRTACCPTGLPSPS